jgi:predicted porin
MKKNIIAAAVAAIVAVPAVAQVTVYGRLDAGYQNKDVGGTKSVGVAYSSDTSSRFGITAAEDLGGGLKAVVVLEGAVASADIPATGTTTATDVNLTDRAMHVTLSSSAGSIRLGFQNAPGKDVQDGFDAGGANNIEGKLPDTMSNDQSRVHALKASTSLGGGVGVYGMIMNRNASGASTGSGYALGGTFASGPMKAEAVYNVIKSADPYDTKQASLGASYDLGMAQVMGFYHDITVEGTAAAKVDESGFQVGIKVPVTASAHVYAQYHNGDSKTGTAVAYGRDGYQLGAKHSLSKRTYVYGIYGQHEIEAAAGTPKSKTFAFGVAHSF